MHRGYLLNDFLSIYMHNVSTSCGSNDVYDLPYLTLTCLPIYYMLPIVIPQLPIIIVFILSELAYEWLKPVERRKTIDCYQRHCSYFARRTYLHQYFGLLFVYFPNTCIYSSTNQISTNIEIFYEVVYQDVYINIQEKFNFFGWRGQVKYKKQEELDLKYNLKNTGKSLSH